MSRSVGIVQVVLSLLLVLASIDAGSAAKGVNSKISTEDHIRRYKINSERYRVTTSDGYDLAAFRLRPTVPIRGVALLQHGIRQSSADWLVQYANLPAQLLDIGIEVWLGDSRASPESLGNRTADPWAFSFHEIGMYDLPALIDAALQISKFKRIHLVGYSEGSTAALVLLSELPSYNAKIASLNLIAPAAYMSNSDQRLAAELYTNVRNFLPFLLPKLNAGVQAIGSTPKQLDHYRQLILSGCFRQYDYGTAKNVQRYGTRTPPEYQLAKISTSPVILHYGGRDGVVSPRDVQRLGQQLSRTTKVRLVSYEQFAHRDFLGPKKATIEVYPKIAAIIAK
ncbi:lipase 1 [Culex quinquefasciatus]|uniref:Lipase 1 n=1 Tax=Culex quinquefasciatus TaxID=7176 RepID=B0X4A6_CULQU|nr:lipase 1 [Culex quinquefasciatus]EDS40259.1 lipase 1 [Culex quinquefasciatus]|eukprot:XP_001864478.1 lipase 1 [Culex quinquefasciatus]